MVKGSIKGRADASAGERTGASLPEQVGESNTQFSSLVV